MKRKIISYNPRLKVLARNLRNHSTKSEIILWQHLKGKQLLGYDFHRQRPIDNYIVDFFCHELLLAIELDGITHEFPEVIQKDKIKEKRLRSLGIQLLRFDDDQVIEDIDWVIEEINLYVLNFRKTHPPTPLERGGHSG